MFILRWEHSRSEKNMSVRFATHGQALIRVMMVRKIYPNNKFTINGKEV